VSWPGKGTRVAVGFDDQRGGGDQNESCKEHESHDQFSIINDPTRPEILAHFEYQDKRDCAKKRDQQNQPLLRGLGDPLCNCVFFMMSSWFGHFVILSVSHANPNPLSFNETQRPWPMTM